MNELPSSDFRKTFPRLKEATQVNANGHTIGLWIPFDAAGYAPVEIRGGAIYGAPHNADGEPTTETRLVAGFNSRPFTPVPRIKGK